MEEGDTSGMKEKVYTIAWPLKAAYVVFWYPSSPLSLSISLALLTTSATSLQQWRRRTFTFACICRARRGDQGRMFTTDTYWYWLPLLENPLRVRFRCSLLVLSDICLHWQRKEQWGWGRKGGMARVKGQLRSCRGKPLFKPYPTDK